MRRVIATVVVVASLSVGCGSHADAAPRPHHACQSEDSAWCVWDARHTGNGLGRSFWTDHAGNVHYVSHARAHRMLHR